MEYYIVITYAQNDFMIGVIFTIYGYARVSSKAQLHGNSLDEQTATLKVNGATNIIAEQYSGKTISRPKLQNLIDSLNPGDTLMVTKLDCLARNVTEGIELIKTLFEKTSKFMFLISDYWKIQVWVIFLLLLYHLMVLYS